MASGALDVELVGCTDPILESYGKVFLQVLLVVTLEYIEILDAELLVFVPPESQPGPSSLHQSCRVQQVVDLLVIYLQKAKEHAESALFIVGDLVEEAGEYFRDDALGCFDFFTVHSVSLAGTSLTVGEDSGVVALQALLDHVVDGALLIDIFLGGLLIEYVVEVKVLLLVAIVDLDFLAVGVDLNA